MWVGNWDKVGAIGGKGMRHPCWGTSTLERRTRGLCFPFLCITPVTNFSN